MATRRGRVHDGRTLVVGSILLIEGRGSYIGRFAHSAAGGPVNSY
jgi:hypothetical protein